MNTYAVMLEVGNAVMTKLVQADEMELSNDGVALVKRREDGTSAAVAFYPYAYLVGVCDMAAVAP
jgi:hypothetical protein